MRDYFLNPYFPISGTKRKLPRNVFFNFEFFSIKNISSLIGITIFPCGFNCSKSGGGSAGEDAVTIILSYGAFGG